LFTEAQSDVLAHVIAELRKQWREERDAAITPLKAEIADLKGKFDVALTLLGQKEFNTADVIDLPDWRKRDAASPSPDRLRSQLAVCSNAICRRGD
jgi:hypothetical protein